MLDVTLPWSDLPHLSNVIAGFQQLEAEGLVACHWRPEERRILDGTVLEVEVRGRRLFYDESDGYCWDPALTEQENLLDFCGRMVPGGHYFKRSFHPEMLAHVPEGTTLAPLGLSYKVEPSYRPYDSLGARAKRLLRTSRTVRRLTGANRGAPSAAGFEALPAGDETQPSLLFSTRLWDPDAPDATTDELREERHQVNTQRVALLRALREGLGPRATAGLVANEHAARVAPDLVLPAARTEKGAFLDGMRRAAVVGTSIGLAHSIGWRMGEAVAASRAIISDPLYFQPGGGFAEGENYLQYTGPDDVCQVAARLLDDPAERQRLRENNHRHHAEWGTPAMRVLHTLVDTFGPDL